MTEITNESGSLSTQGPTSDEQLTPPGSKTEFNQTYEDLSRQFVADINMPNLFSANSKPISAGYVAGEIMGFLATRDEQQAEEFRQTLEALSAIEPSASIGKPELDRKVVLTQTLAKYAARFPERFGGLDEIRCGIYFALRSALPQWRTIALEPYELNGKYQEVDLTALGISRKDIPTDTDSNLFYRLYTAIPKHVFRRGGAILT